MNTSKQKPIHIFAAGKRTASNGDVIEFTQSMLGATAAAYDPAKHEAPFVKGHPKTDDPAYGWAASLISKAGVLLAVPRQVEAAFAEDVKAGRWKKRSAAFYPPNHKDNPVPGVYYLKHIGFLGAVPPSVKGMPDAEFSEQEEGLLMFSEEIGVAEFSEYDDVTIAALFRRIRDWFIGEKGLEVADSIIPDYQVAALEQGAQDELRESQAKAGEVAPAFSESKPNQQGDEMSAEDKAELERLRAENATIKEQQVAFAEAETKRKSAVLHDGHVAFAEGLVKEGKLLPANKDLTVATLDFMASQEQVIEFGEGDAKKPLLEAHKAALLAAPKLVEFAEVAGAGKEGVPLTNAEVAQRARDFKARMDGQGENISFAEAVDAVAAGKDKQ
jgi:hypothetical protein